MTCDEGPQKAQMREREEAILRPAGHRPGNRTGGRAAVLTADACVSVKKEKERKQNGTLDQI